MSDARSMLREIKGENMMDILLSIALLIFATIIVSIGTVLFFGACILLIRLFFDFLN
jgi:hypothetical protein